MTKADYLNELQAGLDELLFCQEDPFYRGQYIALDYAKELAKTIRTRVPYKYSKNVNVSFTKEQARFLAGLLGNGELEKAIKAKLERGLERLCQ